MQPRLDVHKNVAVPQLRPRVNRPNSRLVRVHRSPSGHVRVFQNSAF
jgi:hypothetical protein